MIVFILLLLLFCFIFIKRARIRVKKDDGINPYIERHLDKMKDDEIYNEYLEFCKQNAEIPLNKVGFDDLRLNEWKAKRKLNKYGFK